MGPTVSASRTPLGTRRCMYIPLYACVSHLEVLPALRRHLPVSVKKVLLRRRIPLQKSVCKNIKSGAGEEFLLLFCRAKAHGKGVFFHRHRYVYPPRQMPKPTKKSGRKATRRASTSSLDSQEEEEEDNRWNRNPPTPTPNI